MHFDRRRATNEGSLSLTHSGYDCAALNLALDQQALTSSGYPNSERASPMSFIAGVLIVTGIMILVVSFFYLRKPTDSMGHIAVHQKMSNDQIENQLKHRPPRAEAGMCIFFGLCFIVVGILWQAIVSYFWWGVP